MLFLDLFEKIPYNFADPTQESNFIILCNIFKRIAFIQDVINNPGSYYYYDVKDADTPMIIASKIYNDSTAHWIIMLANNITNYYSDWLMDDTTFKKFIIKKYGSVALAKTTPHHYEKIVTRTNNTIVDITKHIINKSKLTDNNLEVPYDYYDNLPETQSIETINYDNKTVIEKIERKMISNYDYEFEKNESKRKIKIIKKEYYLQILQELQRFTKTDNSDNNFIRRLI